MSVINDSSSPEPDLKRKIIKVFEKFECWLAVMLAFIVACVLAVFVFRLVVFSYILIFSKVAAPTSIMHENFANIVGKIVTILIAKELLDSIIGVIYNHNLKDLVKSVTLITSLTICRKLILLDIQEMDTDTILAFSGILVAIAIFYFVISSDKAIKFMRRTINNAGYNSKRTA